MNEELSEKTGRIVEMLEREGLDAVLLNARHNFAWLTCGGTNGVDTSRENGVATLMVTREGRRYVIANNIETPRMLAEEVPNAQFEPLSFIWQAEKADGGTVAKTALSVLRPGAVIAADIDVGGGMPTIEGKVAACRHRLTADEAVRFRRLGSDAGAAMRRAINRFEPGDTEIAIAEKIRHELASAGAVSVVTLAAADDRIKRFRHPVPTANRWQRTLLAVTCAQRGGLIVSLSRIVTLGTPDDELIRRTQAAADVFAALRHATRPGTTGRELYEAAERAYRAAGFPDEIGLHHQGGAAGYKTRDWVAHPASSEEVKLGQAFAWNPSITGTKVEETCIVTEGGTDVVTASPDFPLIAAMIGGTEYLSPGILSL